MPQSLAKNLVHLVFSTKNRNPVLTELVRRPLHGYAAGIFKDLDCHVLTMNSVSDHIHILFDLHKNRALTGVVMEIKGGSSKWLKTQGPGFSEFQWQRGYGAFSVSQSAAKEVSDYIENQSEHHRTKTFQEEFRVLLQRYQIAYDERFVWD